MTFVLNTVRGAVGFGETLAMVVVPHGGQRTARANALAAVQLDAERRRCWGDAVAAEGASEKRSTAALTPAASPARRWAREATYPAARESGRAAYEAHGTAAATP